MRMVVPAGPDVKQARRSPVDVEHERAEGMQAARDMHVADSGGSAGS